MKPLDAAQGTDVEQSSRQFDWSYLLLGGVAALGAAGADRLGGTIALAVFAFGIGLLGALLGLGWIQALWSGDAEGEMQSAAKTQAETIQADLNKQVVPVWRRHIEGAKSYSETSMADLLGSFAAVSMQLDEALGGYTHLSVFDVGSPEEMLATHRDELDQLTNTTRLAVKLKDDMLDVVQWLSDTLSEMVVLSKEVESVSRATHLLALNASVEATRAGESGGGFAVVATEVRALAGQSRQVGMQIGRLVSQMQERINSVRGRVRRHDTDEDEIARQAELNAHAILAALIGSVAGASSASRALRDSSKAVQDELENISVSLQSQDRLSQMLTAVTNDMQRMEEWLNGAEDAAALHPVKWLERLESSYTMEEMKASHHNLVMVDKESSGVQFF